MGDVNRPGRGPGKRATESDKRRRHGRGLLSSSSVFFSFVILSPTRARAGRLVAMFQSAAGGGWWRGRVGGGWCVGVGGHQLHNGAGPGRAGRGLVGVRVGAGRGRCRGRWWGCWWPADAGERAQGARGGTAGRRGARGGSVPGGWCGPARPRIRARHQQPGPAWGGLLVACWWRWAGAVRDRPGGQPRGGYSGRMWTGAAAGVIFPRHAEVFGGVALGLPPRLFRGYSPRAVRPSPPPAAGGGAVFFRRLERPGTAARPGKGRCAGAGPGWCRWRWWRWYSLTRNSSATSSSPAAVAGAGGGAAGRLPVHPATLGRRWPPAARAARRAAACSSRATRAARRRSAGGGV